MYYIYDNYREDWYHVSFAEFEDAENAMKSLIEDCERWDMPYDFDIYEKVT